MTSKIGSIEFDVQKDKNALMIDYSRYKFVPDDFSTCNECDIINYKYILPCSHYCESANREDKQDGYFKLE